MLLRSKILVTLVIILPWALIFSQSVCNRNPSYPVAVIAALFGAINVYTTLREYKLDLQYYETSGDLSVDSRIKTTIPSAGEMTGYTRLFLYYPLMFAVSSSALFFAALQLICSGRS
jgi:hypothetical protein